MGMEGGLGVMVLGVVRATLFTEGSPDYMVG